MNKPPISRKAFWDVNFETLDFERSSLFVMQKVFNYGTWDDQIKLLRFYGKERIKKEITGASYLRQPVLSFLCTILHLTKNDFKCYTAMQLNPLPWPYK
jgi:hypothetical protein